MLQTSTGDYIQLQLARLLRSFDDLWHSGTESRCSCKFVLARNGMALSRRKNKKIRFLYGIALSEQELVRILQGPCKEWRWVSPRADSPSVDTYGLASVEEVTKRNFG